MLTLRKWQEEAIKRSDRPTDGIFLEALGGRGKTVCALEIAKHKKAKKVLVVNNRIPILNGWKQTVAELGYDFDIEYITDRSLQIKIKDKIPVDVDILILDEWQNLCSESNVRTYARVKRDYTIGLSATPIRKKGQNFYPLEKTIYGKAEPNTIFNWRKKHGKMVYDPFTYSKERWQDFLDYDSYIANLPNFFGWEEIEKIEKAEENNGFETIFETVTVKTANPELLKKFRRYNIVTVNGKSAMAKQSFGRATFERYLNQAGVDVVFPKLIPTNRPTPLFLKVTELARSLKGGVLIVTKSRLIADIIKNRNFSSFGIWTGNDKRGLDNRVLVATMQTLGVGVDGLQHKYHNILVLDPVDKDSGEYDDYRQLLWRVTGSRQQHDVKVIEFKYQEW